MAPPMELSSQWLAVPGEDATPLPMLYETRQQTIATPLVTLAPAASSGRLDEATAPLLHPTPQSTEPRPSRSAPPTRPQSARGPILPINTASRVMGAALSTNLMPTSHRPAPSPADVLLDGGGVRAPRPPNSARSGIRRHIHSLAQLDDSTAALVEVIHYGRMQDYHFGEPSRARWWRKAPI